MKHLQQLAPDMFGMLELADESHLRATCLVVSENAISSNQLSETEVLEAIGQLRTGNQYTKTVADRLDRLLETLDNQYFDLKDQADESTDLIERERLEKLSGIYFRKARAVAALRFAGTGVSFDMAADVIYEAAASVDDRESVFTLVKSTLSA